MSQASKKEYLSPVPYIETLSHHYRGTWTLTDSVSLSKRASPQKALPPQGTAWES